MGGPGRRRGGEASEGEGGRGRAKGRPKGQYTHTECDYRTAEKRLSTCPPQRTNHCMHRVSTGQQKGNLTVHMRTHMRQTICMHQVRVQGS